MRIDTLIGFAVSLALASSAAATGFAGIYDPTNWTLSIRGGTGGGSVDVSAAPDSITLVGPSGSFSKPTYVNFGIVAVADGTIEFDWSYTSGDIPGWDPFFVCNPGCYIVTDDIGPVEQSGSYSVPIQAGALFSFQISRPDGFMVDPATVTISSFVAPIPEPGTALLLAVGLAGLGATGRRGRFRR